MARIELNVSLFITAACDPEVRAWFDLEPHRGLSSEFELALSRPASGVWCGSFHVDPARCEQFAYRIGLRAHADAEWSLRLSQTGRASDLLVDSDSLVIAKCWLVGSCGVQRDGGHDAPERDRRGTGGRHLVLIPGGAPQRFRPRSSACSRSWG